MIEAPNEADAWSVTTADIVLEMAILKVQGGKTKAAVLQQLTEFRSAIHAHYIARQLTLLEDPDALAFEDLSGPDQRRGASSCLNRAAPSVKKRRGSAVPVPRAVPPAGHPLSPGANSG